jgi:outer membrane lipoprotein-sorting protein
VKLLRTLPTSRLVLVLVLVVVLGVGAAAAIAAGRGGGPVPPKKPLAKALHDSLAARAPLGVTARIRFTNRLFPSGALAGPVGSALMSGASGRLWATADGRGRLELQSDAGDAQIVWNRSHVTVFDASTNTVYRATLPRHAGGPNGRDSGPIPSVAQIATFLSRAGEHAEVSAARPTDVGGQAAYSVRVSPKHDGGLLGAAELAFAADRPVPLRVGIYAQGASAPVLELAATHISFGRVPASDVRISTPNGAKVTDLGKLARRSRPSEHAKASGPSGAAAVRSAPFAAVAPAQLVGLPRQDVRLVGHGGSKALVAVYGHGLGAILVVEHAGGPAGPAAALGALPTVALDGVTGHELATQLGTALTWKRNGVSFVLAGSVPPAAAEAAARALR